MKTVVRYGISVMPYALIAVGAALLLALPAAQAVTPMRPVDGHSSLPVAEKTIVHIDAPELAIDLPVKPGVYDPASGRWSIDTTAAFSTQGTSATVLYAHNRAGLFSRLHSANAATTVLLRYRDGSFKTYHFDSLRRVSPNDTSILTQAVDKQIILLTCDGWLSEARTVVVFTETMQ